MRHPHRTYQPRDTEHSVPHTVIREHLEGFLREVSDRGDGHGLPRFIEQEFRELLTSGVLSHGFTRLRCADCTFERLVPEVALVPGNGGIFEVRANGAVLWSRRDRGRFPDIKELKQVVRDAVAPGKSLGHSDR